MPDYDGHAFLPLSGSDFGEGYTQCGFDGCSLLPSAHGVPDGPLSGMVVSVPDVIGEWLSPPAAADRLGISERTLWRHVKRGRYHSRVVDRRAEIMVPVTGDTSSPETALAARHAPDSLTLAIVQELQARREQDTATIERLTARLVELERENARLLAEDESRAEALEWTTAQLDEARRPWWKFWA